MNVVVTCSTVKGNNSMSVNVTDQMETANEAKIQAMQDVVCAFFGHGLQKQIEVTVTPSSSPVQTALANPSVKPSNLSKKISSSQQVFLLKLLKQHEIPVQRFCQDNGINRIEDLSMDNARTIIADLKNR